VKRLVSRTRGSAVVEVLVVFPIFFAFFAMIVQLVFLELAGIAVQHAAIVGVRGAVVVAADDPKFYAGSSVGSLNGKRKSEVDEAIDNVLRFSMHDFKHDIAFSGGFGEGSIVKATLVVDYKCEVPVGRWVVCGTGLTQRITREASMPTQTAGYIYP
jgi:hypothetical protein